MLSIYSIPFHGSPMMPLTVFNGDASMKRGPDKDVDKSGPNKSAKYDTDELFNRLYKAIEGGHTDAVRLLIDQGANIQQADGGGQTPLHYACQNGHTDIVRLLIENGSNIDRTDKDGRTPLHLAAVWSHTDTVRLLIERGAYTYQTDKDGCTPLHFASKDIDRDDVETVELLIEMGSDVNKASSNGKTALHIACEKGHTEIARFLIESGANIHQALSDGTTPLHLACRIGDTKTVRLLVEWGADVDQALSHGVTSLHIASAKGHSDIVRFLIEQGANVRHATNDRLTPFYLASLNKHQDIVYMIKGVFKLEKLVQAVISKYHDWLSCQDKYIVTPAADALRRKNIFQSLFTRMDSVLPCLNSPRHEKKLCQDLVVRMLPKRNIKKYCRMSLKYFDGAIVANSLFINAGRALAFLPNGVAHKIAGYLPGYEHSSRLFQSGRDLMVRREKNLTRDDKPPKKKLKI